MIILLILLSVFSGVCFAQNSQGPVMVATLQPTTCTNQSPSVVMFNNLLYVCNGTVYLTQVTSGTGAPSATCNSSTPNFEYIQIDAIQGQRLWLCDNSTGSYAWDHFAPPSSIGTTVTQQGLTNALGTQTICDTSSACPAGFYTLFVSVDIVAAGTLLSAITSNIQYSDLRRANNVSLGGSLSLLSTTPATYTYNFYHAANTAVTVTTTATTLTGSPSYDFYARLVLQGS